MLRQCRGMTPVTERGATTLFFGDYSQRNRNDEGVALTITQAARACGLTVRAVRYYETLGMIDPPRLPGRARIYHGETLRRLRRLAQMRLAGLTATEIMEEALLEDDTDAAARLHAVVCSRLAQLSREQAALNALLDPKASN